MAALARLNQLAGPSGLSAPSGGTNCQALASGAALVCIFDNANAAVTFSPNSADPLDGCKLGYKLEISSKYAQPLYLPLIGNFLGSNGSKTTRSLTSDAEATCEQ